MGEPAIFRFTAHAIERYLERIRPDVSHATALAELFAAADSASLVFASSALGDPVYSVEAPPMLWIVKHEAGMAVVVTVIADPIERKRALAAVERERRTMIQAALVAPEHASDLVPARTAKTGPRSPARLDGSPRLSWACRMGAARHRQRGPRPG